MNQTDRAYFSRRARQERKHASQATRPETRIIHAELADRYDAMLATPTGARNRQGLNSYALTPASA